ncbi:MAG: hypothetical protein WB609_05205 [Candidatus Cybelea sp.]
MMTNQLDVSILAAPLAAIDRRALSQAWYSALRLVPQVSPSAPSSARRRESAVLCGAARRFGPGATRRPNTGVLRLRVISKTPTVPNGDRDGTVAMRQAGSRARLAERIERTFSDPRTKPKRATFSLGRGRARVHVVLQTGGGRTTLLAICRPELRAVVARALVQARIALANRGVGIEYCAIGEGKCF